MFNILIQGIFKLIKLLTNIILLPINALVVSVIPDFSDSVTNFNNLIQNYIGGGLAYFSSILPPLTRSTIIFYLNLLVILYTTTLTIHLTLKIFKIIKAVKFW